jgi:hypothetical protein
MGARRSTRTGISIGGLRGLTPAVPTARPNLLLRHAREPAADELRGAVATPPARHPEFYDLEPSILARGINSFLYRHQ